MTTFYSHYFSSLDTLLTLRSAQSRLPNQTVKPGSPQPPSTTAAATAFPSSSPPPSLFSFMLPLSRVALTFPTALSVMTHCPCHCHDNPLGCSLGLCGVFTGLLVSALWSPGCARVIRVAIVSVNSLKLIADREESETWFF